MKNRKIEVLAEGLRFPEGPAFDSKGGLWAVELKGESLLRYFNGSVQRYFVGGAPNGIAIDSGDQVWFCDSAQQAIRKFNAVTRQTETVVTEVEGVRLNGPNDLAFDRAGNLLFTCPGDSRAEPSGYVCVLMKNGTIKKIMQDKYFPNGLAFTATGEELVIAETYRHRLWKGKWDSETGNLSASSVWCNIGGPDGPGGPDGMAFNAEGDLYVAVYGTGELRIVNKEGTVCNTIRLPGMNPTNCAFDPFKRLGLVVTEAEKGQLLAVDKTS